MREPETPNRLVLNISEALHKEAKKRALLKNITLRSWVTEAIITKIKNENKYDSPAKDDSWSDDDILQ